MSFHPCADNFSVGEKLHTENVEKTVNHQHQNQDECSPFCSCACCSVRAISKNNNHFAFHLQQENAKDAQKLSSKPIDISISIWQPPQLA
ncbi:hypothetical protein ABIB40_000172 [Pedobacter sp. UYP30]